MTTASWRTPLGFAAYIAVVLIGVSLRSVVAEEKPEKPKPPPPKITISKETTWATEPVRKNGYVDYFEAVNRHFDRGVTPQNNAVVLLYQATGPSPDGTRQLNRFFERLGIEPLPDEGNYFQPFRGVANNQSTAYYRPWNAEEFPDVANWLTVNEGPLRHVTEATSRTHYFSPLTSDDEDGQFIAVLLPGVQTSRELGRALTARAMLRLGEGATSAAWRDLMTVHRLGRFIGQGPTLIEGLVGCAIESFAIQAELRLISESQPSAKFVALYVKNLERLPRRISMADKIDTGERAGYLDCAHHIARGQMGFGDVAGANGDAFLEKFVQALLVQSVDWDEILKSGNKWYDRLAEAGRKPTYRERVVAMNVIDNELKALTARRTGPQALLQLLGGKTALSQMTSDILISLLTPSVIQTIRAEQRVTQRMHNLEVALALAAWRSEHDSYPGTLDELVPKYLATLPQDTFLEKPLRYEKLENGYRFYSVGENEKDDDGRSYDDMPRGDDLVVQMPLPQPKPN